MLIYRLLGSALTAENLSDVVKATGNEIPSYYPTLFAAFLEKSGGCAEFCKMSAGGTLKGRRFQSLYGIEYETKADWVPRGLCSI